MFYEMHKHKNHFILVSFTHYHFAPNLYDLLSSVECQRNKTEIEMWFSAINKVPFNEINIFAACFSVK